MTASVLIIAVVAIAMTVLSRSPVVMIAGGAIALLLAIGHLS